MKIRINIHTLLFFMLLQLVSPLIVAQSFTRMQGNLGAEISYLDVAILKNGSYVCVGGWTGVSSARLFTVVYSPTGQLQKIWRSNILPSQAYGVVATDDGGYIIAGQGKTTQNSSRFLAIKFDARGDSIWGRNYALSGTNSAHVATGLVASDDGGYVIAGYANDLSNSYASALKIDANGDSIWQYSIGSQLPSYIHDIAKSNDGGYLMAIRLNNSYQPGVIKLDANGVEQWRKIFSSATYTTSSLTFNYLSLVEVANGNIVLSTSEADFGASTNWWASFYMLNAQGDSLDRKIYGQPQGKYCALNDITLDKDGGFYATGKIEKDSANFIWLLKLDDQLDTVWTRAFGDTSYLNFNSEGFALKTTDDGGCVIAGRYANAEAVIMKIDSAGNAPYNIVNGEIIADINGNCTSDIGDATLANWNVQVATSNGVYYGNSNLNGEYSITVYDTGVAQITTFIPNNYWQPSACQQNPLTLSLPNYGVNPLLTNNFYAQPTVSCEVLSVNLSTAFLRRCFSVPYQLNYCNHGTVNIDSAYVVLEVDPLITVDSSTQAWLLPQSGNLYQFNLGSVALGECGTITIWVTADCDAKLNQSLCITARGYPANICDSPDSNWDGSSIKLYSQCVNDTVKFEIKNEGTGSMAQPLQYIIVEDNVMYKQGQFQLLPAESIFENILGSGFTYTMIANQSLGHPGYSFPINSVEGCGTNALDSFSLGYTIQFPQDDDNDFVDILCQPVISSFDPNDKRPEPLGLGAEGYINATQQLDYTIRFQNTGNDTAFLVVIRDTLPQYLDITTLQLTGASHGYTFQIIGSNVLEWTFDNILLPDSNVNEPLSHGYVSFHINQVAGNAVGTEIRNRAGIYFDFNPPVITNYTLNTVVENYWDKITVGLNEITNNGNSLQLYPNPNSGQFYIELQQPIDGEIYFKVYDLAGKQLLNETYNGAGPHTIAIDGLNTGMYLYQLKSADGVISTGKVLINK